MLRDTLLKMATFHKEQVNGVEKWTKGEPSKAPLVHRNLTLVLGQLPKEGRQVAAINVNSPNLEMVKMLKSKRLVSCRIISL